MLLYVYVSVSVSVSVFFIMLYLVWCVRSRFEVLSSTIQ